MRWMVLIFAIDRWRARADKLTAEILENRGGEPLDVDWLLEENRKDLEERIDHIIGIDADR